MAIAYTSDLSFTYTNDIGSTLTNVILYEYEIGGFWNEIDNNDSTTLADGESIVYDITQDNLYKIEITYLDGAIIVRIEYMYLVTDNVESYILTLLKKLICYCNSVSINKQKDYYQANKFFLTIGAAIAHARVNRNNSTSALLDSQLLTVIQLNERLSNFNANCTIEECTNETCNCY